MTEKYDNKRDLSVYENKHYIQKYKNIRHSPDDLFKSEKYFIPRCLATGISILDIGCACGGFYNILNKFEPTIKYHGIDISEKFIKEAKYLYPSPKFDVSDATKLKFEDNTFDLVQFWGVTVHEPKYKKVIEEAWRVSKNIIIFDIRLQINGKEEIDKNKCYVLNPSGIKNHYLIPNGRDFFKFINKLNPAPVKIEAYGYPGNANKYTTLPNSIEQIYFTSIGLYHTDKSRNSLKNVKVSLDLPFEFIKSL